MKQENSIAIDNLNKVLELCNRDRKMYSRFVANFDKKDKLTTKEKIEREFFDGEKCEAYQVMSLVKDLIVNLATES